MATERYSAEALRDLFHEQRIATMSDLKKVLGSGVDMTVFRKLRELSYHTSYSHRGRYYTLDEIAEFDELGLWSYASVWFSSYGTLLKSACALVESSKRGYFTEELADVLQVRVKDALLALVRRGRLAREQVFGRWLYCSSDAHRRSQQLMARRLRPEFHPLAPFRPEQGLSDELKAAIVIFCSLLDEKQRRLYAGLESLKWGHGGDRQIARLLGFDEKTVAKGRKELLSGDIEPQRVRKEGAGRPPVKKGRQK